MEKKAVIESHALPASQISLGGVLRIPAVHQVLLLVGVAAAVAAGFAVVLWSQTPAYTKLYSDLDNANAAQVAESLRAAGIDFKLDTESGVVLVAESRLHDARLELASQGLPQGSAGMDMIQEQSSFGVSQFMEGARYQHALEAELARTISHLGAVSDARVHLAMPKQSAFMREQKGASASVLLQLYRGRELEPDQASSIVHLVASSIPNLTAGNVTLIDQNGRLLSSAGDQMPGAQASNQFRHAQQLEETYRRRIEELLTPLVGPGRVRAQVVANLDFTITEETRESFDPARTAMISEQISQSENRGASALSGGVPGALSNQPPEATGDAGADSTLATAVGEPVNKTSSSMRNFEVDRTVSHVRPQPGTIRRLSVAVLVDDSPSDGAGTETLTESDVERYTTLIKEAVGFDAARGDTVVVMNAAFRDLPEPIAMDEPKFWEKPVLRDTLKQVLGAVLVLILAFGLVRPMLRSLVAGGPALTGEYIAAGGGMLSRGAAAGGNLSIPAPNYDEKVAAAKNMAGHDPARVAAVVRKWVTVDG
ncbi:MAG: flagellar basal-body MS-ring/collar protein FliF [Gammaproteobacteria bacterium]|nr:flagellar basal-body MS-ring/collar protein FliF [Gammaproteobacteria bacterium]MDH5212940.1 flagellar basal-body MS-ring/collar protein FliF [Gammaproteobacteria bacterium]